MVMMMARMRRLALSLLHHQEEVLSPGHGWWLVVPPALSTPYGRHLLDNNAYRGSSHHKPPTFSATQTVESRAK